MQAVRGVLFALFGLLLAPPVRAWVIEPPSLIEAWAEVMNAQSDAPNSRCASDQAIWREENHNEVVAYIPLGPACKSVLQPPGTIPETTDVVVEYEWFVGDVDLDRNHYIAWNDTGTHLSFHTFGNGIWAEKWIDGRNYSLEQTARWLPVEADRWHRVRLERSGSAITFWLNGVSVLTAYEQPNEPSFPVGKPALGVSTGAVRLSSSRWRHFVAAEKRSAYTLMVPHIRQDDDRWGHEHYDAAEKWSGSAPPTLARWGCALTSAVMVLQFHGFSELASGEPLTPSSLNSWLRSQVDGYVLDGLVNWRALTRLTYELAQGTRPSLRFSFLPGDASSPARARQEIMLGHPVILDMGTHFTTAYGYDQNPNELFLHDPLFTHTRLSDYPAGYESGRLLVPTSTDLRSLVIVSVPEVVIEVLPDHAADTVQAWAELLQPAPAGQRAWWQEVSQPLSTAITVRVHTNQAGWYPLSIFTYNRTGQVTHNVGYRWVTPAPQTFTITWTNDGDGTISASTPPQPPDESLSVAAPELHPLLATRLQLLSDSGSSASVDTARALLRRLLSQELIAPRTFFRLHYWLQAQEQNRSP